MPFIERPVLVSPHPNIYIHLSHMYGPEGTFDKRSNHSGFLYANTTKSNDETDIYFSLTLCCWEFLPDFYWQCAARLPALERQFERIAVQCVGLDFLCEATLKPPKNQNHRQPRCPVVYCVIPVFSMNRESRFHIFHTHPLPSTIISH